MDSYIMRISVVFGVKSDGLQIQNKRIKGLNKNVYYNRRIGPADKGPEGGGFSGGGSVGY